MENNINRGGNFMNKVIIVNEIEVNYLEVNGNNYISLTDIARRKNAEESKDAVKNWIRKVSTLQYLVLWEQLNNDNFKGVEFDPFGKAGTNAFTMSPQNGGSN